MRLSYFLLPLLLGYFQSFSQDQIVTISGDTISGNVLDVDQFVVTYRSGENQEANQTIEIYNVDTILRFVSKEMKKAKRQKSYLSSSKSNKMRGPRVFVGAGYGYVTGAVNGNEFVQNYAKGLRHGVVVNGGITYFFGRYFGLGINYTYFHSENSLDFVVGQSGLTGEWGYSHTYDRIHVNTISVNPTARFPFLDGIIMLNPGITVGYKFWKDKTFFTEPFIISASGLSFSVDIGLDFKVYKGLYLGLKPELFTSISSYTKFKGETVDERRSDKFNMSRIDVSVGLRYYF